MPFHDQLPMDLIIGCQINDHALPPTVFPTIFTPILAPAISPTVSPTLLPVTVLAPTAFPGSEPRAGSRRPIFGDAHGKPAPGSHLEIARTCSNKGILQTDSDEDLRNPRH